MNGESQRSRNGQAMFTESNAKSPFAKLRFDVESLISPLGGGSGSRDQDNGLRFGMPADTHMDDALKATPATPAGFVERMHRLVDELSEDTAA